MKFLLCLNGKVFDFRKTSFWYYGFSVATNVFLWDFWVMVFVSQERVNAANTVTTYFRVNLKTLGLFSLQISPCQSQ